MGEGLVVIESLERGRGGVVVCCVMVIAALCRDFRGLKLDGGVRGNLC